jgi:hypothetical protein
MIGLLFALAVQAADPAVEPPTAPPAPPARAAQAADPVATLATGAGANRKRGGNSDERFCRNEAPMGTRIPVKRCYNKQEFQQRQIEERRALEKIQADARAPVSG